MNYKYLLAKPDLSGNEQKYLNEVIDRGVVSGMGEFVNRFEEKFAEYIGTKYAVACASGTAALTIALAACGIGEGDEVIVPEFTMIATAWAVEYVGAKPVFVDCGVDLNIDPQKIREKITNKTKAIIPVHIYGRPCDMEAIEKIAWEYNLQIIEDCAEAHGAQFNNKKVGSFGSVGCFSLYGNKIITCGEGGICTTDDYRLYLQLKHYRKMAFDEKHSFFHPKRAWNFTMTNMQGAVALAQLERIDEFLQKRWQIQGWYDGYLGLNTISRPEGSVLWFYDVLEGPGVFREKFEENWVETRPFFRPMSEQPMYRKSWYFESLKAKAYSDMGFYLPVYTQMTKEDVDSICSCLTG